jgi:hypothetical protein
LGYDTGTGKAWQVLKADPKPSGFEILSLLVDWRGRCYYVEADFEVKQEIRALTVERC